MKLKMVLGRTFSPTFLTADLSKNDCVSYMIKIKNTNFRKPMFYFRKAN